MAGIVFDFLGLVAFFWAGLALWTLVITFGFFALIDGIILIIMYAKLLFDVGLASLTLGIISILIGLYTLLFPGLTAIVLALFFAMYALAVAYWKSKWLLI